MIKQVCTRTELECLTAQQRDVDFCTRNMVCTGQSTRQSRVVVEVVVVDIVAIRCFRAARRCTESATAQSSMDIPLHITVSVIDKFTRQFSCAVRELFQNNVYCVVSSTVAADTAD